jgi:hypothetical protein
VHAWQRAQDADRKRAVSHWHDDRRGFGEIIEQLLADRLIAVELRGLGAVLEEERLVLRGVRARSGLRFIHVGAGAIELGALRLNQRNLRGTRLLRYEDNRAHAGPLGRPGGGRAVIARRRGHDDRWPQLVEHCLRSAPLERTELVLVFALQPDAV